MQVAYKFKLHPNQQQIKTLENWQHKVGYIQNRSLGDRIATYNQAFVMGDYCDLYTHREINGNYLYCDVSTKALTSPFYCSVNRSASLGNPWKEDKPNLRRGRIDLPFNPRRNAYEMHSNWVTEYKRRNPDYKLVSADAIQQALRHVEKAFSGFFSGKSGFPNFKQHKNVGFEFKPGDTKLLGKHITFPVLGQMRFFKSREVPENWEVRTATISRDADGWYVSVLFKDESISDLPIKPLEECQTIQGADVGIKKLVALSGGTLIPNPQFLKKSERRLAIRQRRVSRKRKGSNKRKKAAKLLSRVHQKVRRQREDYQWKAAKKIVGAADITVFEDLNVKGMKARCKPNRDPETGKYLKNGQAAKSALNKLISDASWYSLRKKAEHQAPKLGNRVVTVNPKNTSRECPECHYIAKGNRDKEKFICSECGYSQDADVNGAHNQAVRGKDKLGIDTLRVVSPKVTPTEISPTLVGEPGNPAKLPVEQRQLLLVKVKSTPVKPLPQSRKRQKVAHVNHMQLSLFENGDWDAEELTS